MSIRYRLKNLAKRGFVTAHKLGVRCLGLYILPVHYYAPLANIIELERTRSQWAKKSEMAGVRVDLEEQIRNMRQFCSPYQEEVRGNRIFKEGMAKRYGPGFGYVEAQALHGVIRHLKPRRMVEVGCGVSTYCMLEAANMNREETGLDYTLTCIEPYPSDWLTDSRDIRLVHSKVQAAPMDCFLELEENDFVFLDSSHAVRTGGDVNHMVLEVFPRLKPGVVVHIHDMNWPYDYPRWVAQNLLRGAEATLIWAYMIHNSRASILFCLNHLHYERPEAIKEVFPEYDRAPDDDGLTDAYAPLLDYASMKHFPASLYLRV